MRGRCYGRTENQAELPPPSVSHSRGSAVLNSLGSPASRRVYECSTDQFIAWYCSELRLAPNRIPVVRYRMHLESRVSRQCHQPATRARSQARTRKRRLRFAESRISCGDQPSERSQATRVSLWQLVERRAKLRSDQNALVRTACVPNETTPWLAVLFGCGFRRQDDEYCYRLVQVCTPVHPGPNWW